MKYSKPQQPRAVETEERLLNALDVLLREKSLSQMSIDEIADQAHVTRGAFLKRFGSKKQALLVLWERYGQRALGVKQQLVQNLASHQSVSQACAAVSSAIEHLQMQDFSANRAMFQYFEEELQANAITKMVFMECVDLMVRIRKKFLHIDSERDTCDFSAAQLLITLNYNYVLRAMPGFPADHTQRHKLIGQLTSIILSASPQ